MARTDDYGADRVALIGPSGETLGVAAAEGTLLASAARTTTTASADQTNANARGVKVFINMTVVGTGSITASIQAKDPVSGSYVTLLASAAITTNVMTVLTVCPGLVAAANVVAVDGLPRTWRVNVVANNANAATYSVGFSTLP